eukprot:scaffold617_cov161-Pinguiococcus_pyrenoidosus.AAC.7
MHRAYNCPCRCCASGSFSHCTPGPSYLHDDRVLHASRTYFSKQMPACSLRSTLDDSLPFASIKVQSFSRHIGWSV